MITPRLRKEEFEVEAELECVKQRMELWKRSQAADEEGKVDEKEVEIMDKDYQESKNIYEEETGTLDMTKLTVTDMKYNTRSDPMRAAPVHEEIVIQVKRQEMMNAFQKVQNTICDRKGYQKTENITDSVKEGMKKLNQRRKKGEIVITTTDKSGKLAVIETNLYKQAAAEHLTDPIITPEVMKEKEIELNRHVQQISKALKMGTGHGTTEEKQEVRMHAAQESVGGRPGPIYFLIKDHKATQKRSSNSTHQTGVQCERRTWSTP